ncbi:MAG: hypothetical protein R6V28_03610 [Nitriliruptoraceae bacterium]
MPEVSAARLPVPHLFMVVSIGFFALMMVSAFAPAQADGGATPVTDGGSAAAETAGWSSGCVGGDASCAMGVTAATAADPAVAVVTATAADPAVAGVDGLTVGSLIALLALLSVTVGAGRAGAHGSGRPIVGLVAGLLAGLAAATSLFSVGAITLSSPTWVYVPLVLSTLGTALGTTAPLQRR